MPTPSAGTVRLGGYATLARALKGAFGGRLERTAATTLDLERYSGAQVEINGELLEIGASGIELATTDNLLAADGTDSTLPVQASTLYYCYVSNSAASYRPSDLGLSATSPSLLDGFKYLATTGNGANWRFAGWVRTNASTQFVDTPANRGIANYYNRQRRHVRKFPGYNDNNAATTFTENNAAYAATATSSLVEFIANGEDAFTLTAVAVISSNASTGGVGIEIDGSTDPEVACPVTTTANQTYTLVWSDKHAEGYVQAEICCFTNSGNMVFAADSARQGATFDPRGTALIGEVSI